MAHLYLVWCIWRERNVRNFEDREILVVKLKSIMIKSIYTWTMAYNSLHFPSFFEFWIFVLFLSISVLFCILLAYLGCASLRF
jgi:hypothetical protein